MKVLHVSAEGQEEQTGKIQGQLFSEDPVTDSLEWDTKETIMFSRYDKYVALLKSLFIWSINLGLSSSKWKSSRMKWVLKRLDAVGNY